jgi:4-amino-4-deoxy-L-arabinose transferase-like glycosyltransferase
MIKILNIHNNKLSNISWHILPPTIYIILVNCFFSIREVFSFDSDEGINLIKSLLLMRGYPLYSATWSDQPPLLTYLLAGVFKLFGLDVNIGRALILFFAALLVWSFTQYMLCITNRWTTLISLLLLLVLPYFVQLSVSVMVGLPAIALGSVALLFITRWHQTKKNIWLILSGVMLALSILIKLITGILVPIFIAGVFIDEYFSNKQAGKKWFHLPQVCLFYVSFAAIILVGMIFLIHPANINQLIFNHLNYYQNITTAAVAILPILIEFTALIIFSFLWYRTKHSYWLVFAGIMLVFFMAAIIFLFSKTEDGNQVGISILKVTNIKTYIKQAFELIIYFDHLILLGILAVIGSVRIIKTKRVFAFYAITWAAAGWLFLCLWRPIWYHHLMLFAIPAAILASIAFVDAESVLRKAFLSRGQTGISQWVAGFRKTEWISFFILLLFVINWGVMGKDLLSEVQKINTGLQQPNGDNQISFELMSHIMVYAPQTKWMITDAPMFAFRANIPTPPYLAVISHKRLWSGELFREQIGDIIETWKPEMILFSGKIDANYLTKKYINSNYTQIFSEKPYKLYLRDDVLIYSNP